MHEDLQQNLWRGEGLTLWGIGPLPSKLRFEERGTALVTLLAERLRAGVVTHWRTAEEFAQRIASFFGLA